MISLEEIYRDLYPKRLYIDRSFRGSEDEYIETLKNSCTVYVGGLNPSLMEERIWGFFSLCGEIKRVIMGINKHTLYPCGFCFIEYYTKESANKAILFNSFTFDGNEISVGKDWGFKKGREYGRGFFGNQNRTDLSKKRKIQ